jgi:hypothetical protein
VLPSGAFITAMPRAWRLDVDRVDARAGTADHAQAARCSSAAAGTGVAERTSKASTSRWRRRVRRVLDRFGDGDVPAGEAEQGETVFMDAIASQHFHSHAPSREGSAETTGEPASGTDAVRHVKQAGTMHVSEKRGRLAWESATRRAYHALPPRSNAMTQQAKGTFEVKRSANPAATWAMASRPGISASTRPSRGRWRRRASCTCWRWIAAPPARPVRRGRARARHARGGAAARSSASTTA